MKKSSKNYLYNSAFSMLELVFVIVIIGILAATIIPQTQTNPLEEAAIQVASHIKYTQHLAIMDDRYDANRTDKKSKVKWYKERWQLVFTSSKFSGYAEAYTIFSDRIKNSTGGANEGEIARNPENSTQIMTGGYGNTAAVNYTNPNFMGMEKLNIGHSYGVTSVKFTGGCGGKRISFDHLGRPLKGSLSSMKSPYNSQAGSQRLIKKTCHINLSDGSDTVSIHIEPETGYVSTKF